MWISDIRYQLWRIVTKEDRGWKLEYRDIILTQRFLSSIFQLPIRQTRHN